VSKEPNFRMNSFRVFLSFTIVPSITLQHFQDCVRFQTLGSAHLNARHHASNNKVREGPGYMWQRTVLWETSGRCIEKTDLYFSDLHLLQLGADGAPKYKKKMETPRSLLTMITSYYSTRLLDSLRFPTSLHRFIHLSLPRCSFPTFPV